MSSIQVAQRSMGFKTSAERPRCGTCRQCELRDTRGKDGWRCKLGGFMVSPYAICDKYEAEGRHTPEGAPA